MTTDCQPWRGAVGSSGYGVQSRGGRTLYAHRVAWEANNGPPPEGFHVHHECGNKVCVNPLHLQLVAATDHARLHVAPSDLTEVLEAHEKVERLTRELEEARAKYREAIKKARREGETVSELARRLGLSRARVHQYLRD